IMTWVSFFIGRLAFIFSKEVFDKPLDHQILNINRGIKILLKK
ncbi:membrane protein, partial [Staphylococcus aureus]